VEHRIGVIMLLCLTTLATILFVYGLFDGVIHEDVITFVRGVQHQIEVMPKEVLIFVVIVCIDINI
jgi:hypothetical protein